MTIIPIGGGKGGIGKTTLTANLGIAIASLGFRTIVVDLDLGGSNLYNALGLKNDYPGIGDFLLDQEQGIEKYIVETKYKNLFFLPGDGKVPFLSNVGHDARQRLLCSIKSLDADYILLDLSPGSSRSTLEFFLISKKGILLLTPDRNSIMNTMSFAKHLVYHQLRQEIQQGPSKAIQEEVMESIFKRGSQKVISLQAMIEQVRVKDPYLASRLQRICYSFIPRVVINMGDDLNDLHNIQIIEDVLLKRFSVSIEFFGFLFFDEKLRKMLKQGKILFDIDMESKMMQGVQVLARRVIKFWNQEIPNSFLRLEKHTEKQWKMFGVH